MLLDGHRYGPPWASGFLNPSPPHRPVGLVHKIPLSFLDSDVQGYSKYLVFDFLVLAHGYNPPPEINGDRAVPGLSRPWPVHVVAVW